MISACRDFVLRAKNAAGLESSIGLQILPEVAVRQAAELTLEACGHRPTAPFPPLPTEAQIALAKAARVRQEVARPILKPRPGAQAASGSLKQLNGHAGTKRPREEGGAHASKSHQANRSWWQPTIRPGDLWALESKKSMHASSNIASNGTAHAAKRIHWREPQYKRIKAVLDAHAVACQKGTEEAPAGTHADAQMNTLAQGKIARRSMGPSMDRLPPDTLSSIMSLLAHEDLVNLAQTCHGMWLAAKDGAVWRNLLHRQFPSSQLTASSAADWEYTYNLQVR